MKRLHFLFVTALFSLLVAGCGNDQASARPDVAAIPAEDHFGGATKDLLYEFRAKVRKRGLAAAQQEVPLLLEAFDGFEQAALGQHADTYHQIFQTIKELEGKVGSASRDEVVRAAEELGTLADSLPGEADPNPEVE